MAQGQTLLRGCQESVARVPVIDGLSSGAWSRSVGRFVGLKAQWKPGGVLATMS